jgi:hypothetical protein
MKFYATVFTVLLAFPAIGQTGGDSAADKEAMKEMSTRTGTTFYSDDTMTTMRSADEIKSGWTTLSAEDQDAIRARCTALTSMEPSKGDGTTGEAADGTAAAGDSSGTTTAEDLGYMGDEVRMREICTAVTGL